MANDLDMLNDIEDLKKNGKVEESEWIDAVYCAYFIENDLQLTKELIKKAEKTFPSFPFNFGDYGINIEVKE